MSISRFPRVLALAALVLVDCSSAPAEPTGQGAAAAAAAGSDSSGGSSGSAASAGDGAPVGGNGGNGGSGGSPGGTSGVAGATSGGGALAGGGTGAQSGASSASGAGGETTNAGAPGAGAAGQSAGNCPPGAFLCEAFDSYPPGAAPTGIWTKTTRGGGAITVDTTRAFSGAQSLHATGVLNGDIAHITTPLSITANTVFVRFMMYTVGYPSSTGVHSRLARLGTTADSGPDSAYSLSSYNGTAIEKVDSIYLRSTAVHLNDDAYKNKWFCLEFEIDKTGGIGKVVPHIWIDGSALTLAAAGSSTHAGTSTSWDPIPFEKFTLGLEGNQVDAVKGDYWLDDVAIAAQRIGCPAQK